MKRKFFQMTSLNTKLDSAARAITIKSLIFSVGDVALCKSLRPLKFISKFGGINVLSNLITLISHRTLKPQKFFSNGNNRWDHFFGVWWNQFHFQLKCADHVSSGRFLKKFQSLIFLCFEWAKFNQPSDNFTTNEIKLYRHWWLDSASSVGDFTSF